MTFVRQSSQSGNKGYTPLEKLGSRHDAPSIVKKVRNWNYPAGRNGVAFGYLKIDEPGDYVFKTYGYYDRNSLVVGGKLVCPYRGSVRGGTDSGDPKQSKERIRLTAGLAPIAAIGFVDARGKMEVLWCPPGKSQFEAIPESRLLHDPQWMSLDTGADIQARLKAAAR